MVTKSEREYNFMTSRFPQKYPKRAARKILGGDTFAAISAVEGLSLTPESKHRLERLKNSSLSPDQRRAEVIRAYMTDNPRR